MRNWRDLFSGMLTRSNRAEANRGMTDVELAAGPWSDKGLFKDSMLNPSNVIDVKGLKIIDEMMNDDALGSYVNMKIMARLATPGTIEAASESNKDQEVAAFVRAALWEYCENDFRDVLRHTFTALPYGFSLSEKVLTLIQEGPHRGFHTYSRIIPQKPHQYKFKMDAGKRIAKYGIGQEVDGFTARWMPTSKFIHYAYNSQFDNPYGQSDIVKAYNWWITKKLARGQWAMYNERFACPFTVATFNDKTTKAERDNLKKVIENLSAYTSIMVPDTVDIKVFETNGTGAANFKNAIDSYNVYMARAVLVPDLLGFSAKPTGSYALGKKHFDVFLWVLRAMGEDIEEVVREQIISELVCLNYGPDVPLPRFVFEPLTMDDKIEVLASYYEAVNKGVVSPSEEVRDWVAKMLNAPKGEEPDEPTQDEQQQPGPTIVQMVKPDMEQVTDAAADKFRRSLTRHEYKVDFASVQDNFDTVEDYTIRNWREVALEQRGNMLAMSRKMVDRKDVKGINDLRLLKVGRVEEILLAAFATAYANSRYEADKELKVDSASDFCAEHFEDFIIEPLPPAEAVRYFKGKGLNITGTELATYKQQARIEAGKYKNVVLAECKASILIGIRDGDINATQARIKQIFDKYVETGEMKGGEVTKAYRIENVVRTNVAQAINGGRRATFKHPDADNYIEAYQVSAVLDGNTTTHCASMDGRILSKEELDGYGWPPWHYQCRTLIVPIIRGEQYEIDGIPPGLKQQFGGQGVKVI